MIKDEISIDEDIIGDLLFQTVKLGKTTFTELSNDMTKTAKQEVGEDELLSFINKKKLAIEAIEDKIKSLTSKSPKSKLEAFMNVVLSSLLITEINVIRSTPYKKKNNK